MIKTIFDTATIEDFVGTDVNFELIQKMDRFASSSRRNIYAAQAGDDYIKGQVYGTDLPKPLQDAYWDLYQNMISAYRVSRGVDEHGTPRFLTDV